MTLKNGYLIFLLFLLLILVGGCAKDHTRAKGVAAYEQIRNINPSSSERLFLPIGQHPVEAWITLLTQEKDKWKIRIDKVQIFPDVSYYPLKKGDVIDVNIVGFIEGYARKGDYAWKNCTLKESSIISNASRPFPKIIGGHKWLANLYYCTSGAKGCKSGEWSALIYNPEVVILEYECIGPDYYD